MTQQQQQKCSEICVHTHVLLKYFSCLTQKYTPLIQTLFYFFMSFCWVKFFIWNHPTKKKTSAKY